MAKKTTKKKNKYPIPSRVWKLTNDLEFLFGLQNFDREYRRMSKDLEDRVASVKVDEKYQRITISLYPNFFKETIKQQREALLHEFCHYLTDPLYEVAHNMTEGELQTYKSVRHANELSTSRVAQLVDALLRGKKAYARKAYAQFIHTPRKR